MVGFSKKALWLLLGFFLFFCQTVCAQDQKVADSLSVLYHANEAEGEEKLELLRDLAFHENEDPDLALAYAEELIRLSKLENNQEYLYSGCLQKGYRHLYSGDSENALLSFFSCAEIAVEQKDLSLESNAYQVIANVYAELGNYDNGEAYYSKAIQILRKTNDSIGLAATLNNAADMYLNHEEFDKSLAYLKESGAIYRDLEDETGIAYVLGGEGMVYAEQGKDFLAEKYMNEAIAILEEKKNYQPVSVLLIPMSDIYLRKSDYPRALEYAQRSLDLALSHGLVKQISEANLQLYNVHVHEGKLEEAIVNLKDHYVYRDSLWNIDKVQQMADLRTDYEVSQKQLQVDLLSNQKRTQRIIMYSLGLFLVLAVMFYKRISKEKDRSDLLLLNILPHNTAKELKENGKVKARKFDAVTVMFTDFQAFTRYSQDLSPEKLVKSVDYFFSAFDKIIGKYGLEKIKTIGDAYMCAGGIVAEGPLEPVKMIHAAFEILEFVHRERESDNDEIAHFNIRIGINTGPVVGGVVGTKKFAFDIWGDTVNVAARMETNSTAGRINISENTYQLVKDCFECTYRGEIDVKNKGMMKMYFVEGPLQRFDSAETDQGERQGSAATCREQSVSNKTIVS